MALPYLVASEKFCGHFLTAYFTFLNLWREILLGSFNLQLSVAALHLSLASLSVS